MKRKIYTPNGHVPDSEDMIIPDDLRKLPNGDDFLLADKTSIDGRVLIFGTVSMMKKLCAEDAVVYADGTFKACPKDFAQLFTVHVEVSNYVVPALYCIMTNRTAKLYTILLETVKNEIAPRKYLFIIHFKK